jgi:hypothetical protein
MTRFPADMRVITQSKSPWKMGRAPNPDPLVGNDVNRSRRPSKTMILIPAQIHFVVSTSDSQCLRQFSGTRTKPMNLKDGAALPHQRDSASWLECTDENEPAFLSFHQNIQHPVNAVVKINVSRPSLISFDERARTWANKAMTGFIADCVIGFRFNDYPGTRIPLQFAPNKITGAAQRVALEKISPQQFAPPCHRCQPVHFSGL